ncbi:SDR family NAD(P)-dependent oxidoreductase [Kutzneria buriramensis]|uniref:3-oxoacyl-[acyl-carrier protein] reductase n=1 Tax=Kutzneria buriramensis TaxID=1045776 RepID=A0A3E0G7V9_9PSEU|nr:SDR family oxidoreductase [Kutzneria buriramensis]REH17907.1 3-oxoacyl-[acyl-carrier protein] reductase [Kutzneria buriramensis]
MTRVAVITGASRGIGAAAAVEFGRLGYAVVVNYHSRRDAADSVVEAVDQAGGKGIAVAGDMRVREDAAGLIRAATENFGRVDTVVCNASTPIKQAAFADMPWEDFATKVTDELAASYHVTQLALPVMRAQRYGRLVYVSSGQAERPGAPGMIGHGSAKAALNTFARYVAYEEGPHGITANVVAPGYVRTDSSAAAGTAQIEAHIAARTPLRRVADPLDVGRVIAMIGSENSGFATGITVPVNGGVTLAP